MVTDEEEMIDSIIKEFDPDNTRSLTEKESDFVIEVKRVRRTLLALWNALEDREMAGEAEQIWHAQERLKTSSDEFMKE